MTKNIYTIFTVLIIGAIVWAGVATFYTVLESRIDKPVIDSSPVTYTPDKTRRPRTKRKTQYEIIKDGGLFGKSEAEAQNTADELDLEGLAETSLNITLIGTIPVEGDPESSYAIISVKSKRPPEDSYRVGDSVEGAIIKSIRRKMVVLRVNGEDQILMMNNTSTETAGRRTPSPGQPPAGPPGTPVRGPNKTVTLNSDALDESFSNLPELLKNLRVKPHITDGEQDGIEISGIDRDSVFRQMQIINGDVIKSVDGKEIKSSEDLGSILNDLQSSEKISVEILRRGRLRTYEYNIK